MRLLVSFLLFAAAQLPEREVVRKCLNGFCAVLSVRGDTVRFRESGNFIPPYVIGPYIREAQRLVPQNEAPIRAAVTSNKWRAIVSAFLDEYDSQGPLIRLR